MANGCAAPEAGESSSSTQSSQPCSSSESSQPSSSLYGDSSQPSSSSYQDDPSKFQVFEAADFIAYSAHKYDENVTRDTILSEAKSLLPELEADEATDYGDMFLLAYSAFNDSFPAMTGARKFEGMHVSDGPVVFSHYDEDDPRTKALTFFVEAGLADKEEYHYGFDPDNPEDESGIFNAGMPIAKSELSTLLDRIHGYYGTSPVDDFHNYANYDIRIENCPNEGDGPLSGAYYLGLASNERLLDWTSIQLEQNEGAKRLEQAFLTIGEANYLKDILLSYQAPTTLEGLYQAMLKSQTDYGYSPLYESLSPIFGEINGVKQMVPFLFHLSHMTFINADTYATYFSALLGDETQGKKLAEDAASFLTSYNAAQDSAITNDPACISDEKIGDLGVTIGEMATSLGIGDPSILQMANQRRATAFYGLFKEANLDILKGYCAYQTMTHYMVILPDTDAFNSGLFSISEGSRFENQARYVSYLLPLYMPSLVNEFAKTEDYEREVNLLTSLVASLKQSMEEKIPNSFLSEDGREKAKKKLTAVNSFILNDDGNGQAHDYIGIDFSSLPADATPLDYISANDSAKWNGYLSFVGPCGREKALTYLAMTMSPSTVNAFYDPSLNALLLLPGFMISAGLPSEMSKEQLYSRYGWVLAHEIGHGYDGNGFLYDDQGDYSPEWMNEEDRNAFDGIKTSYLYHLRGYETSPGQQCVPSRIINEALADNIGVSLALASLRKQGSYSFEAFFESGATFIGGYASSAMVKRLTSNDSHPMNRVRVNKVYSCFDEFHETYKTQEGDFMYLDKDDRIVVY